VEIQLGTTFIVQSPDFETIPKMNVPKQGEGEKIGWIMCQYSHRSPAINALGKICPSFVASEKSDLRELSRDSVEFINFDNPL
jgi:hypothetical protein